MTAKYDFTEAINAFFIESREMLEDMEDALLILEKDISSMEPIPAIFRAAHTIKGSAGMFGFNDIGDFTHVVENLLDDIRNNVIPVIPEIVTILLECHDHILKLLDYFDGNREAKINDALKSESVNLLTQLNSFLTSREQHISEKLEAKSQEEDSSVNDMQVMNECWHISLRFGANVFKNGLDPQSFITYLSGMGKIVKIKTLFDAIPSRDEMDPETCYLGFEINFMGYTTKEKIEAVFEYIQDDCVIRILAPGSNLNEYVKLIEELAEEPMYMGEILIEVGSLTKKELEEALKLQKSLAKDKNKKRIGEIVVDEKMVHQPVIEAAINKQTDIRKSEEKSKKSMRIDTSKLDTLINLVGELVISASNIERFIQDSVNSELAESFSQMSRLVDNIRESSMNIRMVQIGDSFKRFERVVRDISREKGKQVELILNGGETELDKTIIEKVMDPLMHLVRNAVDHGIDTPDERIAKGKGATGRITLNAYHEAGNIVIEISDDGNGLNKEKILGKALEMGLINSDQLDIINEDELYQLIFIPGFSTAEKVTEISGRGVGMDVVKRNIESLRGSLVIQSKEGQGTIVRIYLPLTLAIIDGFLVKAGSLSWVLPLNMVVECANIDQEEHKFNEDSNYFIYRGEIVPYLRIRDFFKIEGEKPDEEDVVIVEYANKKIGFIVDDTFGEFQTVIKPLGRVFQRLEWISGATILGGGEIGLILDVPKLLRFLQAAEIGKAS